MLDDLVKTIQTIQDRIRDSRQYFSEGRNAEWRTRIGLIDPLLQTLGWDVGDPRVVEIEPRVAATTPTGEGWADYALLGDRGRPLVIIEAKNLSIKKPPIPQTVGYVFGENSSRSDKINYCAWTNGEEWAVYDVLGNDKIMEASISNRNLGKTALELLGLWRVSMTESGFNKATTPIIGGAVGTPDGESGEDEGTIGGNDGSERDDSIDNVHWIPLTALRDPQGTNGPSEIRFPGQIPASARRWRWVLVRTAEWLYEKGLFTREHCPMPLGPGRNLFSLDGKHQSGKSFKSSVRVGNTGILMEANLGSRHIVELAIKLLRDNAQDPSQVKVKF